MREILFRGKTESGEWVEGSLVPIKVNCDEKGYEIIDEDGIEYYELDYYNPSYCSDTVIPETIGQYTGLRDKNGKKIFEGDIVRGEDYTGKVEYNDAFAKFYVIYSEFSGNWFDFEGEYGYPVSLDCEVIGNIHDNPRFLEGA